MLNPEADARVVVLQVNPYMWFEIFLTLVPLKLVIQWDITGSGTWRMLVTSSINGWVVKVRVDLKIVRNIWLRLREKLLGHDPWSLYQDSEIEFEAVTLILWVSISMCGTSTSQARGRIPARSPLASKGDSWHEQQHWLNIHQIPQTEILLTVS